MGSGAQALETSVTRKCSKPPMPKTTNKKRKRDADSSDLLHEPRKGPSKKRNAEFVEKDPTPSKKSKSSRPQADSRKLKSRTDTRESTKSAKKTPINAGSDDDLNPPTKSKPKTATPHPKTKPSKKPPRAIDIPKTSPSPPTNVPISKAILSHIQLLHEYLKIKPATVLQRDDDEHNQTLIKVPESMLLGTLITMRIRYEVGSANLACISDVEDAIVERCTGSIGENDNVIFITIDTSAETKFIDRIKAKIHGHGLDEQDILGMQIEINRLDQLKQAGLVEEWRSRKSDVVAWDMEEFGHTFHRMLEDVRSKIADQAACSPCVKFVPKFDYLGDQEHGRRGVCPAPPAHAV